MNDEPRDNDRWTTGPEGIVQMGRVKSVRFDPVPDEKKGDKPAQTIDLNTLLEYARIDPAQVLVLRHRPTPPVLRKRLPWLAAEHPDMFNAYQQMQSEKVEKAMTKARFVASFIAHGAAQAAFVGLYERKGWTELTPQQYINLPSRIELVKNGMEDQDIQNVRPIVRLFQLELDQNFHSDWKGKLVVDWPPPPIGWYRKAWTNTFPISAILEESAFERGMPPWDELDFSWRDLSTIPKSWRVRLAEWRGIYFIFDRSDNKGYVGAACGKENILGRWLNYVKNGHGGNRQLLHRDPENFQFSILERTSQDLKEKDVLERESCWKIRLHTRTHGLNEN